MCVSVFYWSFFAILTVLANLPASDTVPLEAAFQGEIFANSNRAKKHWAVENMQSKQMQITSFYSCVADAVAVVVVVVVAAAAAAAASPGAALMSCFSLFSSHSPAYKRQRR